MNRIETKFESLKSTGRTALVAYVMAGDPDLKRSFEVLKKLPEAGVDIIEIGMPFSDPVAEGPTIQKAAQRALEAGANMKSTLQMVRDFRENDDHTPIILMGYANPLYAYDLERFVKDSSEAGVDGFLIVDLPPEENLPLRQNAVKYGLDVIHLATPTTDDDRLQVVLDGAGGFLYYVSVTGVTGTVQTNAQALKPHFDAIKSKSNLPVAIGFGIRTPDDAQDMAELCDAVVVGSAIVDRVKDISLDGEGLDYVLDLVRSLSDVLGDRP